VTEQSELGRESRIEKRVALDFIFRRIEEQASRTSEALGEDARLLLEYPPTPQPRYVVTQFTIPVPRNNEFEEFAKLIKAAYIYDRSADPDLDRQWRFAHAVFKCNEMETSRLLESVGVRVKPSRADSVMLFLGGLLIVICAFALLLARDLDRWVLPLQISASFCGAGAFVLMLLSRDVNRKHWKAEVERLRRAES